MSTTHTDCLKLYSRTCVVMSATEAKLLWSFYTKWLWNQQEEPGRDKKQREWAKKSDTVFSNQKRYETLLAAMKIL